MTPGPVRPTDAARGIGLMVAAIAVFATMDTVIKGLRGDYGTIQILFFRMAVAAIPTLALVLAQGGLARLRTHRLAGHVGRTLLVLAALGCFFFAFGVLPLADVYAISYAAPLIATALSVPLLGESVGPRRWTAIGVGFVGVVVILQPGGSVFGPAGGLALVGDGSVRGEPGAAAPAQPDGGRTPRSSSTSRSRAPWSPARCCLSAGHGRWASTG